MCRRMCRCLWILSFNPMYPFRIPGEYYTVFFTIFRAVILRQSCTWHIFRITHGLRVTGHNNTYTKSFFGAFSVGIFYYLLFIIVIFWRLHSRSTYYYYVFSWTKFRNCEQVRKLTYSEREEHISCVHLNCYYYETNSLFSLDVIYFKV